MIQILATGTVYCNGLGAGIDAVVPNTISAVVNIIKIVVPIFLIVFGMLDMGKAVMSNDEKVMKEAQGKLIKRVIYAIIVFFIVAIVQFLVSILGEKGATGTGKLNNNQSGETCHTCIDCFINGNCTEEAHSQYCK